jgi:hypothetical protein
MGWWQVTLFVLGCVVAAVFVGLFLSQSIVRLQKKRRLLVEAKINLGIAIKPCTGELLPFKTDVWDTSRDGFDTLPANLQEDLTEAYVDMQLANNIVWLSIVLGRRTNDLDESYIKLCARIAARLGSVMSEMELIRLYGTE